ncbi:MAG: hypothetical protein O9292_13295 [Rhodobacteraceae bacterium]|jgi:hypothetical protein|nr:hypothetical protein [Paracoccaceae bacterium]MCZ8153349.1 hypothetical protein [Paracoccaceae bacterium]MCZ8336404.1 hypothetical protein [Paracoccaceae bacterium]
MTVYNDISGTAALAIIESLLLALNDHKVLPQKEIIGVLQDAVAAHENAPQVQEALNRVVADLIHSILAGGSTLRPQ